MMPFMEGAVSNEMVLDTNTASTVEGRQPLPSAETRQEGPHVTGMSSTGGPHRHRGGSWGWGWNVKDRRRRRALGTS